MWNTLKQTLRGQDEKDGEKHVLMATFSTDLTSIEIHRNTTYMKRRSLGGHFTVIMWKTVMQVTDVLTDVEKKRRYFMVRGEINWLLLS